MLNTYTFDDVPAMHDGMCKKFLIGKLGKDYNWLGQAEVGTDNLVLGVRSFDWNLDLREHWITRVRWNMMVRQYIDPLALDASLDMVGKHMKQQNKLQRGISTLRLTPTDDDDEGWNDPGPDIEELRTNTVNSWKAGKRTSRRWGSCMLTLTFRVRPSPTVTLNSRTSYFGYLALLDVNVAHVFARMCGDIVGIHPAEMNFVWQLNLAQFHGFRSLAWALSQEKYRNLLMRYMDNRDHPHLEERWGLRKQVTGYTSILKRDEAGVLYGDETYASRLRMRRRYHTEIHGPAYGDRFVGGTLYPKNGRKAAPLPPLWTGQLDFSPIKRGM